MTAMLNKQHVTIVGTGLLGASLGCALKHRGFAGKIVGVGRREATLADAKSVGAIDEGVTDLLAVLPETDLLVLAVPLSGFEALFTKIAGHEHDKLVITDVGSTKVSVQAAAERSLQRPELFVGAHPMAGSEKQGPQAADAMLFEGKPCIVCPTSAHDTQTGKQAVEAVASLFRAVGMHILTMTPAEHDLQTAVTSHLPHATSAMLIQTAIELGGWAVASTGFQSATRLASSNPPMRRDIMLSNRDALIQAIDAMGEQMQTLKTLLENGDGEGIEKLLEQSKQCREQWVDSRSTDQNGSCS